MNSKTSIFHVHYKDIKLYPDRLDDVGIMGYPLEYMAPKLPGLGDVDWGAYVSALRDIGYDGYTCVEVEDRAFEGSLEDVKKVSSAEQAVYGAVCHLRRDPESAVSGRRRSLILRTAGRDRLDRRRLLSRQRPRPPGIF